MPFPNCRRGLATLAFLVSIAFGAASFAVAAADAVDLADATSGLWSAAGAASPGYAARTTLPTTFRIATLDAARFHALAADAPAEATTRARE